MSQQQPTLLYTAFTAETKYKNKKLPKDMQPLTVGIDELIDKLCSNQDAH